MKFNYFKMPVPPSEAHPTHKWYKRPIIQIDLVYNSNRLKTYALIDSGADWCVFQGVLGKALSINLESGKKQLIRGITADPIVAYFHDISISIGGWDFSCYVGFSDGLNTLPYGILGQNGFFSKYVIIFDYQKETIELKDPKK